MNATEAKKIVAHELDVQGIPYTKLVASKVSFQDLAREDRYFVQIQGITLPDPRLLNVRLALDKTDVYLDL